MNFWQKLTKPFLILAPMDDVTDTVFRQIVAQTARPDVYFTEFTNCDGLNSKGRDALMNRLQYSQIERPIVAQIWGTNPKTFYQTAQLVQKLGFDGIDINMGCPVRTITRHGACGALIKNPNLAKQLIDATKKGAPNLPLSVKTRIGVDKITTKEWISFLLDQNLAALTIHGRTVKEQSKVPTHWDQIAKAVKLKDRLRPTSTHTLIIGNGDVQSYQEALEKAKKYKLDGIMIGRGIFHNPWVFKKGQAYQPSTTEKLQLLLTHTQLFDQTWGKTKNFAILKKFFKIYASGFGGAGDLRTKLMQTNSLSEVQLLFKSLNAPIK